ncbi:16602_t:CDS:2, partial [Racocetra fulgida]
MVIRKLRSVTKKVDVFDSSSPQIYGLLNAWVFSQDIAVTRAFQAVKLHWWITNVNSYESHYPHRSHNKSVINEFSKPRKTDDFVELQTLNCNNADIVKNDDVVNDDIITKDITDDNNLVLQPSFLEWLRYILLIKLFSPPKNSSQLIALILPSDSFYDNVSNTSSSSIGKNNSKQSITRSNQNYNKDIHLVHPESVHLKDPSQYSSLDSSSHLKQLTSSDFSIDGSGNNQTTISNRDNTIAIDISSHE